MMITEKHYKHKKFHIMYALKDRHCKDIYQAGKYIRWMCRA